MKLELKHLSPYLPYGLKCYWGTSKIKRDISKPIERYLFLKNQKTDFYEGVLENTKPILRPLSDINKTEAQYLIDYVVDFSGNTLLDIKTMFSYKDFNPTTTFKYDDISFLFSNHFDVFGLIDKGLAIENTSEK